MLFAIRVTIALAVLVPALLAGWLSNVVTVFGVAALAFGSGQGAVWALGRWRAPRGIEIAALLSALALGAVGVAFASQPKIRPGVACYVELRDLPQRRAEVARYPLVVHGHLKPRSLRRYSSPERCNFVLEDGAVTLDVEYRSALFPDLGMHDGLSYVVDGRLVNREGHDVLDATRIQYEYNGTLY